MKKVILPLLAAAIALVTMVGLTALPASAAKAATVPAPLNKIPIAGTTSNGGTFTGTVTPTRFVAQNRQVILRGLASGTLRNSSGGTVRTVSNAPVALPVALPNATCPILHLTLGPLDLNLLGLKVHLNQVVLDITAISGPGNLLGNLLCAIAGLLNGTGTLAQLNALLAQLNALLGLLG
ncbi:hypothetical protein [Actinomadura sp. DC4]|uniref:hypothetical protein n=1 Tax=Actinomadura sp. DC4 TaxID=3055069 RepID=UPI0025B22778|nr:hypothetical protein [Actinomadura sp. DC4]MDN3353694.1 hypothetical protein [Actinomadura sp. DC4]